MKSASRLAVFLIALMVLDSTGSADEPLRWKFAAGDNLAFRGRQQMRLAMDGPSGPIASTVDQKLNTTWHVEKLDLAGNAVVSATIDRVQTSMQNADEEKFQYDSANAEAISGLAAMVAPMYDAMVAGEYELAVSPRGEVSDVRVPEDVAGAIKKTPGADATGEDAALEAFKAMLTQGVIPLPESPRGIGETWSSRSAVHVPHCESATIETEYRYDGTKEMEGKTYAVIRPTLTLELAGDDKMRTRVKGQQTTGEILFDVAAGRVYAMDIEHRASIDVVVAGQTLAGTIEQQVSVKTSAAK